MKRKTFLLICAVLIAALLIGVLAACNPGSKEQGGTQTPGGTQLPGNGGGGGTQTPGDNDQDDEQGGEVTEPAKLIFEKTDAGYSVTGYEGTPTVVVIPETYEGLPVTSIRDISFEGCTSLTSVTIPASVALILPTAFSSCPSLERLTVVPGNPVYHSAGNCVIETETGTLIQGCNNSVIPTDGSVTSIGDYAFAYCTSLASVTIPESVTSIGSYAFYNCTSLTSVTIGDGVTSIGRYAFYNCDSLTSIVTPDSVTSIGSYAFSGCTSLTSVTIGSGVKSISSYAFSGCSNLTSITIPDSVTSIGSSAFSGCSSLESMTIPFVGDEADKTSSDTYQYPFGYIFGTSSYTGGTAVTQRYYGDSTTYYTSATYYIPSSLRSVTVTGGNILYGAFYNCSMLTSVTIGDSVTSIGSSAFSGCTSLASITIGNGVTSIGENAFGSCDDLQYNEYGNALYLGNDENPYAVLIEAKNQSIASVNINASTKLINNEAFRSCESLASVTIPDSVTSIGNNAFYGCTNIVSATMPAHAINDIPQDSLETVVITSGDSIGYGAFRDCTSLTSVTIGDSVTSIGSSAFEGCFSLESLTVADGNTVYHSAGNCIIETATKTLIIGCNNSVIPDDGSVTSIGGHAFWYCTSLASITIPDSVTSIGSYAFAYCDSLTSIVIPDSVTSIGEGAFSGCSGLTSIAIGNGVTSIGSSAFA